MHLAFLLPMLAACTQSVETEGPYPAILPEYEDYRSSGTGQQGERMNPFSLPDQNGDGLDYRQLLGYVTVVDVGAIWCAPCQESAATAQALQDALGDQAWVLQILVQDASSGPPGSDDGAQWADQFGLDLPVLADTLQENMALWQITAWPTVFVIAPDGEILVRSDGALPDDEVLIIARDALDEYAGDLRP